MKRLCAATHESGSGTFQTRRARLTTSVLEGQTGRPGCTPGLLSSSTEHSVGICRVRERFWSCQSVFTLERTDGRPHIRIGSANPAVRTRKHEVVSCSDAVSKTFCLSPIVLTKRSSASGRKLKNSLQTTMSVRCFCARRGKPRPPCASTLGFRHPGFNRQSKAPPQSASCPAYIRNLPGVVHAPPALKIDHVTQRNQSGAVFGWDRGRGTICSRTTNRKQGREPFIGDRLRF